MTKVGIIGANGYTGLELMRLLSAHRQVELTIAVSRSNAGTKVMDMYPSLSKAYPNLYFTDINIEEIAANCELVFTALPHSASADIGGQLADRGLKVIDLSADFRYDDLASYEQTYKVTHPRPDLNEKAVYGLAELNRDEIKSAQIIGNPGCYTTSSILALYPLLYEKLIDDKNIIIDAKSGTSGAGRKGELAYSYCEVEQNFKAYGITTHRHTSEIEEKLSIYNPVALSFTPHLLPTKRGILSTIYANLAPDNTAENGGTSQLATAELIQKAYSKFYANERFVEVLPTGTTPELKWASGSNMCYIGFVVDKRLNRVIIVSVIDNLLKGASGQAVQNMNIMLGYEESEGLPTAAFYL